MNRMLMNAVGRRALLANSRQQLFANGNTGVQKRCQSSVPDSSDLLDVSSSPIINSYLSSSPLVQKFEDILVQFHDLTGLHWSTTVLTSALLFRLLVCLPLRVHQERVAVKQANLRPVVMKAVNERLIREGLRGPGIVVPTKKITRTVMIVQNRIFKEEKCQTANIYIAMLLQFPLWAGQSVAYRDLAYGLNGHGVPFIQMTTEGALWFQNLTLPDPYYVLPLMFLSANLLTFKYMTLMPEDKKTRMLYARVVCSAPLVFYISYAMTQSPSSVSIFLATSSTCAFLELLLISVPKFRRLVGLEKSVLEEERPFSNKYKLLKQEFSKIRKFLFK